MEINPGGTAEFRSDSENRTEEIGRLISDILENGDIVLLEGELGSGKTTLVRGIMQGLGGDAGNCVKSPSYTILNIYPPGKIGGMQVHHFDFYRVEDEADIDELGLNDYWGRGICIVEWPGERLRSAPFRTVALRIRIMENEDRVITVNMNDPREK